MSGKFTIKPPIWPRELTFAEFSRLNFHIQNENQLIQLYNQYLNKYLEELRQKKIHFKQSVNNHLLNELINNNFNDTLDDFQDSYEGDASIAQASVISVIGISGDAGPPSEVPSYIFFEGNTRRTFNLPAAADYVQLFDPEDLFFEKGFTISFLARFDEIGTQFTTVDQKFVLGRGASPLSQIRFGIEGNPILGNHFNIGVGDTTVSSKVYSLPNGNITGSGNGFGFGILGTDLMDTSIFNHYALVYEPDNPLDSTTSGSVKFFINGTLTGSFTTRFTPKKNDSNASNYSGGDNFFVGAHNQFRVLAGSVDNYTSVQAPNTVSSFQRYNNNVSGYYDGMACSVNQLYFSNTALSDTQVSNLYSNSTSSQDLEKDEIDLFKLAAAYYKFNAPHLIKDSSPNLRHGIFKENSTNIGVDNYGTVGEDDEVTVTFNPATNEDAAIIVKEFGVLGNKYQVYEKGFEKPKDKIKIKIPE